VKVTREIAGHLANVARSLDEAGHDPVKVAQFLMRCLFTMFVEDIELLQPPIFTAALKEHWLENPESFPGEVENLWRTMNEGGHLFNVGKVWKFNGGLFADPTALPLTKQQLGVLALAATSDWKDVEPAIFGTLLERALNPKERHRLGAHYTPRAYVERLIRPTIEEPLRAEWDNVRAQVLKLVSAEDPDKNLKAVAEARKIVYAFYDRLTKIRVLDPACGSGNFLYVALDLFKRIENEVIATLEGLGIDRITAFGRMVTPKQFLGIEIKEWAKEITELVLWIGWLQWQIRTRGYKNHPDEPILHDYHNIERRDAVLDYDEKVPLLDEHGEPVTRWDGETTKLHTVTEEEVPDDTARMPVYRYVNPRKAEWPEAEYVVGNPPFIGNWRMRTQLGDHYVEVLRKAYADVPEKSDYVMYWWDKAAAALRFATRRFGLITTNSITQVANRQIVKKHLESGVHLLFAVPDHPWIVTDGAAVRVSMTVGCLNTSDGVLATISHEEPDADGYLITEVSLTYGTIREDLSLGAAVVRATPLIANMGMSRPGVKLHGSGFIVTAHEAEHLGLGEIAGLENHIRPYVNGRDLTDSSRSSLVIDLFGLSLDDVRRRYPDTFQWVLERVKPERDQNRDKTFRSNWWIFGRPRPELRDLVSGLSRFIVTVETAKHRLFFFLDRSFLPDNRLTVIGSADAWLLGVLSARPHVTWALAAGGTLEDRPVYNKTVCFDPFPFPDPDDSTKQRIRNLGEQLDAHRKRQQELHPDLTITGMYNVLEKLRSGDALTPKEKIIHEQGLVSVLKQIHDELDAAVFDAYGWPHDLTDEQILERLVALNAERAEEERRGIVRWLRPEFQNPQGAAEPKQAAIGLELEEPLAAPASKKKKRDELPAWPKELRDQVAAVRDFVTSDGRAARSWTSEDVARSFKGSRRNDVASVLEALAALGIVLGFDTAAGKRWRAA
jgi:hypothetical protein